MFPDHGWRARDNSNSTLPSAKNITALICMYPARGGLQISKFCPQFARVNLAQQGQPLKLGSILGIHRTSPATMTAMTTTTTMTTQVEHAEALNNFKCRELCFEDADAQPHPTSHSRKTPANDFWIWSSSIPYCQGAPAQENYPDTLDGFQHQLCET
jgi:hypothetical protein